MQQQYAPLFKKVAAEKEVLKIGINEKLSKNREKRRDAYLTTIFLLMYSSLLEAVMKYNPGRMSVPKLILCR